MNRTREYTYTTTFEGFNPFEAMTTEELEGFKPECSFGKTRKGNVMTLKNIIEESGMTRYKIAKESGMTWASLDRYVNGHSSIASMPLSVAVRLGKVFGLTADQIYANAIDEIDTINLTEGWNNLPGGISAYIEDGKVLRGTAEKNGEEVTVWTYTPKGNGLESTGPISKTEFIRLTRQGKIAWQ